ncbi:MAG: hypothetical protein JXM68_07080 [Sedimentisphaerales bacterium]|nr:hypothetical protein [Sedimentisphaerales bacterium]
MKIDITPFRVIMTGLFTTLILVFIWLYLLFTASPNPTLDYVALYNASNKPANYDESQNAWPVYEQAIAQATNIPDAIQDFISPKTLPTDQQQAEIGKYLAENQQALELLRQAVQKPYCYIEVQVEEGESLFTGGFDRLASLKKMAKMLSLSFLYNIALGDVDKAIADLIACEKLAGHLQLGSPMLIGHLVSLGIDALWQGSAFFLLDTAHMSPSQRDVLQQLLDKAAADKYIATFAGEKFGFNEFLQYYFVGSDSGNGRFAWKCRWSILELYGDETPDYSSVETWIKECNNFLICAFGATRKEVADDYDSYLALADKAGIMTPWQREENNPSLVREMADIEARIGKACLENNYINSCHVFNIYYLSKARISGLQTVLAIKEYQLANDYLPQSLTELVEKQYLQTVPLDPFSDGELVYKITGDSYMLYSRGYDLKDDGGSREDDSVFWPLPEPEPEQADGDIDIESDPDADSGQEIQS